MIAWGDGYGRTNLLNDVVAWRDRLPMLVLLSHLHSATLDVESSIKRSNDAVFTPLLPYLDQPAAELPIFKDSEMFRNVVVYFKCLNVRDLKLISLDELTLVALSESHRSLLTEVFEANRQHFQSEDLVDSPEQLRSISLWKAKGNHNTNSITVDPNGLVELYNKVTSVRFEDARLPTFKTFCSDAHM
jgi:hypothetical protein